MTLATPEQFDKNLTAYGYMNPEDGDKLKEVDCKGVEFCYTDKEELNLQVSRDGEFTSYHSMQGALEEAICLSREFPLDITHVAWCYGLGLGYYYDAIQDWLATNPKRFLIFLEDDMRVIYRFLESERAEKLLSNPQVLIFSFRKDERVNLFFLHDKLSQIVRHFALYHSYYFALPLYDGKDFEEIKSYIFSTEQKMKFNASMYTQSYQSLLFQNLYHNLFHLPFTYYGHLIENQFTDVPAIICGAGPSIKSQLPLLQEIGSDKAIVFASGSAVNVVSRNGITPHFAAGLDPSDTQVSRIATNFAFHVPYYFAMRFYYGALEKHHGDKLYLNGEIQPEANKWFEEKLEIRHQRQIAAEISTSDYCMKLARYMGCNPIIFIGMDLAYSDDSRYPKGDVTAHPLDERLHHSALSYKGELIRVELESGREALTKADWIMERDNYNLFAQKHSECTFINATKEGLPIPHFHSLSLDEVRDRYLTKSFDLHQKVHNAIQNCAWTKPVATESVQEALDTWKMSIDNSLKWLQDKQEELDSELSLEEYYEFWKTVPLEDDFFEGEPYAQIVLKEIYKNYTSLTKGLLYPYLYHPDNFTLKEHSENRKKYLGDSYRYLEDVCLMHQKIIEQSEEAGEVIPELYERSDLCERVKPQDPLREERYRFHEGQMEIYDPELDIDLRVPIEEKGRVVVRYPDGQVQQESYYHNNELHGPSVVYDREGNVRGRSWYQNGKPIGKSWTFYTTGHLYGIRRYREGVLSGPMQMFYKNGKPRTILSYLSGKLHGTVELYYPTGTKKRILHFDQGVLNGEERSWFPNGQIEMCIEYRGNNPVGKSSHWNSEGHLFKEIVHYDDTDDYDEYFYEEKGKIKRKRIYVTDQPLQKVKKKSEEISQKLGHLTSLLDELENKKHDNK